MPVKRVPRSRRPGTRAAFTLVELLVALLITSISLGAIYGVFSSGMTASRRASDGSRLTFEQNFFTDFVSADLRCAAEIEFEEAPPFDGFPQEMSFYTSSARPGEVFWPHRRVTYWFDKPETSPWGSLRLETTPFAGKVPLADDPSFEVLIDRVYAFELSYFNNNRWEDVWKGPGLPPSVRIDLEIGSDDGRSRRTLSVVVDLPSSVEREPT